MGNHGSFLLATRALNEEIYPNKEGLTMPDNNGSAAGAAGSGEGGVKTFTQEEVNAMIGKRVNEINSKYADYESLKEKAGKYDEIQESSKTELQKANDRADALQKQLEGLTKANTVRETREKVSKEMNIPAELLTGEDEETCKKQAEAILKFAKPKEYPGVKKNKPVQHKTGNEDQAMREFANMIFRKGER